MKIEMYDLSDPQELRQFYCDCCRAIDECPQGRAPNFGCFADMYHVYEYVYNEEILWEFEYDSYLSKRAKETFNNIVMNKQGKMYNISNLLPIDNYKYKKIYEKI